MMKIKPCKVEIYVNYIQGVLVILLILIIPEVHVVLVHLVETINGYMQKRPCGYARKKQKHVVKGIVNHAVPDYGRSGVAVPLANTMKFAFKR